MTDVIANVVKAVDIPVIADGGCGFGNPLDDLPHGRRLRGAPAPPGINLEDQVYPEALRPPRRQGGGVAGEMAERIAAAVDARRDPDFVITARVDSLAIHGLDDAIARGNLYVDAGADMVFVEAPTSEEEIAAIVDGYVDPPWINMVEGGKTPLVPTPRLQEMGAALVDYGPLVLFAAAAGITKALEVLRRDGTTAAHLDQLMTFGERSTS